MSDSIGMAATTKTIRTTIRTTTEQQPEQQQWLARQVGTYFNNDAQIVEIVLLRGNDLIEDSEALLMNSHWTRGLHRIAHCVRNKCTRCTTLW
jgi:hypothetical protein